MAAPRSSSGFSKTLASPLGLGLFVAGTAVGALVGPIGLGLVLGASLWGATVVWKTITATGNPAVASGTAGRLAGSGSSGGRRLDPFSVGEPWRFFVRDAQRSRDRFDETVRTTGDGPLRERLESIGRQLDHAVEECNDTALRGHAMRETRRGINVASISSRLEDAQTGLAADPLDETLQRTVSSLQSQLDSADRLDQVITRAEDRLRLLQAQLDEAVARAGEMAMQRDVTKLEGVGDDIEHVVDEMEALRQALEETSNLGRPDDLGLPEPS